MNKTEVLTKAADEIEKRGHTHGSYANLDGEVCALGAMRLVCGGVVEGSAWSPSGVTVNLDDNEFGLMWDARNHLFDYLRAHGQIKPMSDSIPNWNDRSDKDTVVAAMRAAAQWNDPE